MERLTELKVGQELHIGVLYAWATEGNYCNGGYEHYIGTIQDFRVIINPDKDDRLIVKDVQGTAQKHYGTHYFHVYNKVNWTQFKLSGFIEFYNDYYKLNTMERDWHNTVIYVSGRKEGEDIMSGLKVLGYKTHGMVSIPAYIRTEASKFETSSGTHNHQWRGNLKNPTELTYTEAMALFNGTPQPTAPAKGVRTNFDKCEVVINNREESLAVQQRLFDLGYSWLSAGQQIQDKEIYHYGCIYIRYDSDKKILRSAATTSSYKLEVVTVADILGTNTINPNNTLLTPKQNGEIIVRTKATTVTTGQRFTGTPVSGRTSRTKVTVGHLSYQAVSSDC